MHVGREFMSVFQLADTSPYVGELDDWHVRIAHLELHSIVRHNDDREHHDRSADVVTQPLAQRVLKIRGAFECLSGWVSDSAIGKTLDEALEVDRAPPPIALVQYLADERT